MNWKFILSLVVGIVVVGMGAFVCLHGAVLPVLDPKGPVGLQERWIIIVTTLLSAIVVVPVFVLLFFFAWRYRADNPQTVRRHVPGWDHNNPLSEFLWWLVPTAIIAILSVIAWQSSHALDPYKPLSGSGAPMTIEVVALDWKWLFIYPAENIASVNMVEFPVDSPVRFEITADAPMNSFWIPALGGQIMAMPGMLTKLNLMASSIGTFNGFSANISGRGFAGMAFTAKSVTQDDFDTWVQSVRQSSSALSTSTYALLQVPSSYDPVAYYSPVDQGLYTSVMTSYLTSPSKIVGTTTSDMPAMSGGDVNGMLPEEARTP